MSQATVRAAVVAWAKDLDVDNVGTIYRDAPWWLPDVAIGGAAPVPTDPTSLYGAAVFVHISDTTESRITVPAPDPASGRGIGSGFVGNKTVTYHVVLGLVYRFAIPTQLPDGMAEDMWVDGLDQITDDFKQGIRAQPTLGADRSVIFQAGQQDGGITIVQDLPVIDSGSFVRVLARLEFLVDEIIVA